MPPFPEVEVAAALIVMGDRILSVYNQQWGAFTLPMTKRRKWDDPEIPPAHREEAWIDAAARAAAEVLGQTVIGLAELPADPQPFQQSDREGNWKRYRFKFFKLVLTPGGAVRPDIIAEWLDANQFLDDNRRPISPTARHIVRELLGRARLDGKTFP